MAAYTPNGMMAMNSKMAIVTWSQRHVFVFMYVRKMKNKATRASRI